MTLEKKFISHYMLTETIQSEENYCRWLAEDMRSNREVWITEFFERSGNGIGDKWLKFASEIKKISLPSVLQISDFFRESDSVFVVSEIPKGKMLSPMEQYDEDHFRKIGGNLLRALVLLQRNGIGLESLSLNDIFVDESGEIKFFFGEGWILKSDKESREKEIDLFATVLLNYLGFKDEGKVEITQEFLKEFVPEKIYSLFDEILINRKVQHFESLNRYFQEKMKVKVDLVINMDESDRSTSNKLARYVVLGSVTVIIFIVFSTKTDLSQSVSRFDVLRFHMLGYIGMSEPQRILGELYEKGNGVDCDMKESIKWYRKAAHSGNIYAQMSLGHFYDKGVGVLADRKQALYWFTLAATNGDELAKKNLSEMMQKSTDLTKFLPQEQEMIPTGSHNNVAQIIELAIPILPMEEKYSAPSQRFHTYWLHSGSSNNLQKSDQFGGIFGCYGEGLKNPVELVTFNHDVRSMTVDGEGNLYWADNTTGQIIKSDSNGKNVRAIVGRLSHPMGIAVDKQRKLLFWSDRQQHEGGFSSDIGRSDLDGNNAKYIVVNGLVSGGKLKVDEKEGKLYIADIEGKKIVRVNEDGENMIGLVFAIKPEGFDIDIENRKLYWTDDLNSGIYQSDFDGRDKRIVYTYFTTDENFETVMYNPKTQRVYFGKLGPVSQSIWSTSVNNTESIRPQEYVTNFKIHDIIRN
ncbi:MAG: hypothetical protein PHQ22_01780 [Sulfuricurvum sp.]|nr:hypothetical protein [Sulfuricurvum sp.]